ncbi:hypothetical protein BCR33DRAFT_77967 [Rhizoclosmatium globosum]|uniref:STI1 domain-containing protein n=1 Tax=Rhizoclosmatium globosum TaxID=329046 RepID=A0A1Y2CLA0_9FUNG|nr:hypothetical protein BCR33DRAFT_77967 [Rhizoclosmatium globosum]|eukprot:ORY47746.1 hypothetical protein BCR33DRAFT_77967 [Rhizoclosmatium globosum]
MLNYDDHDIPPPLEDMSEDLKLRRIQSTLAPLKKESNKAKPTKVHASSELLNMEKADKYYASEAMPPIASLDLNAKKSSSMMAPSTKPLDQEQKPKKEFSGLKGGFFSKPTTTTKKSAMKPAVIETIKPTKPASTKNENLVFSEVQEAMSSKLKNSSKDWMTTDFLTQIEKDPVLAKAFEDSEFQRAIDAMTKNPQAFTKYAKERPDLMDAIEDLPDFEKELIRKVQTDPELQEILKDPRVMKILMSRDQKSPEFQQALRSKDPEIRRKIEKLVSVGFLSIQH